MDTGLKGKTVLITGGSGGIGSELVRMFSAEGARVAIHYHKNQASAEALASKLKPSDCLVTQADLTSESDVRRMWREITEKLGPVEVLVANSGVCDTYGTPIHQITLDQWNHTLASNLTSIFLCIREFFVGIEKHRLQDPAAILIGSTAGIFGEAYNADYAASKAPLNSGFLLSMKNELARLAPRGRINAICPSWTITSMAEDLMDDPEQLRRVLQTVPLRKVARPSDVASSALFLASSQLSGHCSGQVITVAGGMEGRVLYGPGEIDVGGA